MKSHISFVGRSILTVTMLCACGRAGGVLPNETEGMPQPTSRTSIGPGTATTPIRPSLPTPSPWLPLAFPLSEPGPYSPGIELFQLSTTAVMAERYG